ncbi:MAG: MarR family transcriptional regulator [Alphaproteobacteria bacterium]|nr:MarR family transcriptional regulator [Alphaproteobacteria bacterium]
MAPKTEFKRSKRLGNREQRMSTHSEVKETVTERSTLTVSHKELVIDGDDRDFRELIALFSAATGRMQSMRRELAKALGVSVAEFSVLTALMHLERKESVRVRSIAEHLHVAAAHVTATIKQLTQSGWVIKSIDSNDGRAVSLRLTTKAQEKLTNFAPLLCAVNDRWFAGMSRAELLVVTEFMRRLVNQYDGAMAKAKDMRIGLS